MSLEVRLETFINVNGDNRMALRSRSGQLHNLLVSLLIFAPIGCSKSLEGTYLRAELESKCLFPLLLIQLHVGWLEISARIYNMGTPRPRKYRHTCWNDRGVWTNPSPGLPVVSGR